jgi:hypothetical protein
VSGWVQVRSGGAQRKRKWGVYFVFIYENRRMKSIEIVLRKEGMGKRESNGEDKSKHICKYHNVSSYTTIMY